MNLLNPLLNMKRMIVTTCMLLFVASCLRGAAVPGQAAPDFSAVDIEGKAHQLKDFKGKIVVLEAYNLDCPYSANHYKTGAMPALQNGRRAKASYGWW